MLLCVWVHVHLPVRRSGWDLAVRACPDLVTTEGASACCVTLACDHSPQLSFLVCERCLRMSQHFQVTVNNAPTGEDYGRYGASQVVPIFLCPVSWRHSSRRQGGRFLQTVGVCAHRKGSAPFRLCPVPGWARWLTASGLWHSLRAQCNGLKQKNSGTQSACHRLSYLEAKKRFSPPGSHCKPTLILIYLFIFAEVSWIFWSLLLVMIYSQVECWAQRVGSVFQ